jgi:hypothetical protein
MYASSDVGAIKGGNMTKPKPDAMSPYDAAKRAFEASKVMREAAMLKRITEGLQGALERVDAHCEAKGVPPTVARLCVELDCCKDTLLKYKDAIPELLDAYKRIKMRSEANLSETCYSRTSNVAGPIFLLKANHGLSDVPDTARGGSGVNVNVTVSSGAKGMLGPDTLEIEADGADVTRSIDSWEVLD